MPALFWILLVSALTAGLTGCNAERPILLEPLVFAAPPEVYQPAPAGLAATSRAGLFHLETPENAPEVSYPLTQILFQSLLRNHVFHEIVVIPMGYPLPEDALRFGRNKHCDYIIRGKVPYFLDSGTSAKSGLQMDLRLIDVKTGLTVSYLSDAIAAQPSPMLDYIIWDTKPKPSPSVYALARILAERLALVLAGQPLPALPDPNKNNQKSYMGRVFEPAS